MKVLKKSRPMAMVIGSIIAVVALIAVLLAIPNSPMSKVADAAGPTSPTSGAYSVTSVISPTSLPAGGGTVTMTYTVKNLSTQGDKYLFYTSSSNSVCTNMTSTGVVHGTYSDYIVPGGTATFTCTATIRETSDIKQTFAFDSWDAYNRTGTATETIQLTDRVTVAPNPLASCDTPWFASTNYTTYGQVGTVDPATGTIANIKSINFITAPGVLNGNPTMVGGSSGFAIDPTNPRYGYFGGRDGDVFGDELYRIDLTTGVITSLGSSPAFKTNRMGVDANGTLWSLANDGVLYSIADVNSVPTDQPLASYPTTRIGARIVSHGVPVYYNPATRTTTSFANLQSGDLAFDGTGTLYVLAAPLPPVGGKSPTKLITINADQLAKSSGVMGTVVGDMGLPTVGTFFNGLAFDSKGVLYSTSTDAATGASALWTINMSNWPADAEENFH